MKHTFALATLAALAALACAGCDTGQAQQASAAARAPANARVMMLPEQLAMPGLARTRQVRLYLPPDYATSGKRYPVLYMHDGQNLFDAATANAGEWEVDETMDALAREGRLAAIVVAIDHGGARRMTELNPWDDPHFGKSEGRRYLDFLVHTVKPLIDQRYRTLPDRANTAVMGSSMGGLMSHYALHQYPDVFSKAGIFSPAYLIGDEMFDFAAAQPARRDARMYLLIGDREGELVGKTVQMHENLLKLGHPSDNTVVKVIPGGEHNEALWRTQFREAVLWMFASPRP